MHIRYHIITIIALGTINTILIKLIQELYSFKHGFFVSWIMFISEISTLYIVHFKLSTNTSAKKKHFKELRDKQIKNETLPEPATYWIGLGGVLDFFASSCITFSFIFLPASVANILYNLIIIVLVILSIIILKKKYTLKQFIGIGIIFIGLTVVFIGQIYVSKAYYKHTNKKEDENDFTITSLFIGLFFMIITIFTHAFQMVYQEKLLKKYEIDLFRYVGLEGFYGIIFAVIVLTITSFIKCTSESGFCPTEKFNGPGPHMVDNVSSAIIKLFSNTYLLLIFVVFTINIIFINTSGLSVTHELSSLVRMIIDNIKSILAWIVFLLIPDNEEFFCLEQLIKFAGFAIYIIGLLIYNKMLFATKEELAELEKIKKSSRRASVKSFLN